MRVIRSSLEAARLPEAAVRDLLLRRFTELKGEEGALLAPGYFLVVEPGDDFAAIEEVADWPLFHGLFDDIQVGEDGFSPSWEWLEIHEGVTEIVWIFSDDGGFLSVLIPDVPGIDPRLENICAVYGSVPSPKS